MTLSVKPFGCMPSSGVSDGVQSLISEKFPGTIFCAVETSGDGAVNFYSRVQMYMFKAKQAAAAEFEKALSETGLTLERMREFLDQNPSYGAALHHPPHRAGTTTADLVYEIADVIDKTKLERAAISARRWATRASELARGAAHRAPAAARAAAGLGAQGARELVDLARERMARAKAKAADDGANLAAAAE
jgi:hypothetical protein